MAAAKSKRKPKAEAAAALAKAVNATPRPRVVVLHGVDVDLAHGRPADALAVQAGLTAAQSIHDACARCGFDVSMLPAADPLVVLGALRETAPDAVFQLVESVLGEARNEAAIAGLLELAGLRYTGSQPAALTLALDKWRTKAVLRAHGIPTPMAILLERGDEPLAGLRMPVIVKPVREDASHGIDAGSVTSDPETARRRARELISQYRQPALIEEFVQGREFNVAILDGIPSGDPDEPADLQVLPLAEIDFAALPQGRPHVVTFAAKWDESSPDWRGTPVIAARPMSASTEQAIYDIAKRAYRAIGLRSYGRIDLRLAGDRGPFVLEVNPNPDLSPDAGFARAAERAGLSHDALVERILRVALGPSPAADRS